MMHPKTIRRGMLVAVHLGSGAIVAISIALLGRFGRRPTWIAAFTRHWHRRLCAILGIRIHVKGRLDPGCLLIGNHISWLDIPLVGGQGEIAFLSKAEVRRWPLIGWLADTAGTQFIERGAIRVAEISEVLRRRVREGRTLMIFPEGTTSDGASVLRFHARLFALAQETGLRIQPVALAYLRDADRTPDTVAPFVGDDTLVAHLLRVIRHPGLVAEIHFLTPLTCGEGVPRRALAEQARRAILDALEVDRGRATAPPPFGSQTPAYEQPDSGPTGGVVHAV
jgi:1-acyl-sn-glycerol-3-phosphate acyltransferase